MREDVVSCASDKLKERRKGRKELQKAKDSAASSTPSRELYGCRGLSYPAAARGACPRGVAMVDSHFGGVGAVSHPVPSVAATAATTAASSLSGLGATAASGSSISSSSSSLGLSLSSTEFPGPALVPSLAGSGGDAAPTAAASLSHVLYSSLRTLYERMTASNATCSANCSGRGECLNGTCFCPVQYEGDTCREPNFAYFISFATVFYLIGVVSFVQLVVCIRAEYARMKAPSLRQALNVTTQKMLYFIILVAATLRGAYFSSPSHMDMTLASSFMSVFYPIILTGGSLIVCFWAEAFHLRDIRCERPRFLSKSYCGFLTFNVITYSLFAAEVILTQDTDTEDERSFLNHVFNGCYAVLLFIVVVFFLIYGVEVYFKVRGGFVNDTVIVGSVQSRTPPQKEPQPPLLPPAQPSSPSTSSSVSTSSQDPCLPSTSSSPAPPPSSSPPSPSSSSSSPSSPACSSPSTSLLDSTCFPANPSSSKQAQDPTTERLVSEQIRGGFSGSRPPQGIDQSQLQQSRFGLVFQACMLMITVCFLFSDVLGGFWKNRVPLMSRNAYDILFRVVELGVALWFPCVLWNCMSPEQLWILNPKKILKKLDIDRAIELGHPVPKDSNTGGDDAECWICYDSERQDAGPLIQPCDCKGNMGAVHHDCLRKWLMECAENSPESLSCKVCGAVYQLERGRAWIGQGFTPRHWLHTATLVTVICGTVAAAWAVIQMFDDAMIRSLAAGVTLLVLYVCLRFLGFNTFSAYQRARYSAVKILGRRFASREVPTNGNATGVGNVATISQEVAVDITASGLPKLRESAI
ncbi:uncharacterized protein LOC143039006 isoform X2 [Oratosquilla oratoria]|uniref:uncharacterized protein LOC143039006 isoform X2 n=1 Tax=Oratosquilla oratoria TaxID=337810 RepID=UPI003F76E5A4